MCLAVPAKIVQLQGESAMVESGGLRRAIKVSFIENPQLGDYVLVHAGFAIRKWSEADVKEYEKIMEEMGTEE